MSKLIATLLTTGSLALISLSPAQATTKPFAIANPEPTFPSQVEKNTQVSQPPQEVQVAYGYYCTWVTYPYGYYDDCLYFQDSLDIRLFLPYYGDF